MGRALPNADAAGADSVRANQALKRDAEGLTGLAAHTPLQVLQDIHQH